MLFSSLKYSVDEKSNCPTLEVLDQLLIPVEKKYLPVTSVEETWKVIRNMNVRGAPLIAIVAVLGLTVEAGSKQSLGEYDSMKTFLIWFDKSINYLRTSRPTAVNLFTAMSELEELINSYSKLNRESEGNENISGNSSVEKRDFPANFPSTEAEQVLYLVSAIRGYSENLLAEDVSTNRKMGSIGADAIVEATGKTKDIRMLTICNTGSLATAGYGTALGVIRSLHERGILAKAYACETRPYNQGSRLTAFELVEDELPGCLITDSMASSLMKNGSVDAVVVGADRVAANGDTANKIGTYQLAVACKHHGIPFFVASPLTTVDLKIQSGAEIPIEERPAIEVTHVKGNQIAPTSIEVWNPGFDVTPSEIINGIITERGVAPRVEVKVSSTSNSYYTIDMPGFVSSVTNLGLDTNSSKSSSIDSKQKLQPFDTLTYTAMTTEKLLWYLKTCVPDQWEALNGSVSLPVVDEIGDGNLNLVFIVTSSSGNYTTIVKQALPYIRCVGESWPFTLDRAYFEYKALQEEIKCLDESIIPEVYHFNRTLAIMVMRYIESPHIILRKAMMENQILPTLSNDVARFMAHTLLETSSLFLPGKAFREKVSFWSQNADLCELTETVIFTEPYMDHSNNNYSPELTSIVKEEIQNSAVNGLLIQRLAYFKHKFLTCTEALLHGDLHTGSIMCKPSSSFIIDPEFAFYGPMGFDVGLYIGNMFMSYFSQVGHQNNAHYSEWILNEIKNLWLLLKEKMTTLILNKEESGLAGAGGEILRGAPGTNSASKTQFLDQFFRNLLSDSMGYAACEMIRRIVGIAGVEDLQSIKDTTVKASCEKRGLGLAVKLMCTYSQRSIDPDNGYEDVIAFAKKLNTEEVNSVFEL